MTKAKTTLAKSKPQAAPQAAPGLQLWQWDYGRVQLKLGHRRQPEEVDELEGLITLGFRSADGCHEVELDMLDGQFVELLGHLNELAERLVVLRDDDPATL